MLAALGARLFVQAYGPTHPEPERSRYLAKAYARDAMRNAIEANGNSVFLTENAAGVPIAYAHICATDEIPSGIAARSAFEIVRFYVDSASQGQGVGADLMNHCLAHARSEGGEVVWLQVWSQAPWAVGFYTRMGFTIVGKKPFYFGDRVDEDHVMARIIG